MRLNLKRTKYVMLFLWVLIYKDKEAEIRFICSRSHNTKLRCVFIYYALPTYTLTNGKENHGFIDHIIMTDRIQIHK